MCSINYWTRLGYLIWNPEMSSSPLLRGVSLKARNRYATLPLLIDNKKVSNVTLFYLNNLNSVVGKNW